MKRDERMRFAVPLTVLLVAAGEGADAQAADASITTYRAVYAVEYKGKSLGTAEFSVSYDAAAVYLLNRKTHALELVKEVGYPSDSHEALGLRVGTGIVGWVAKTGEPLIVPDVSQDKRYVMARPETRSELAAPLRIGERIIGVFTLAQLAGR